MDKGPWKVDETGRVCSDDFDHDVNLIVSGDFTDDEEFMRYSQWLCGVLNADSEKEKKTKSSEIA